MEGRGMGLEESSKNIQKRNNVFPIRAKNHTTLIGRDEMIWELRLWGRWQRSAKNPGLSYTISQFDTPLEKKRNVKPIFESESAEKLDQIMTLYLPADYVMCLELTYVEQQINHVSADILNCSVKTFTIKRNEAISMLRGIYNVINRA